MGSEFRRVATIANGASLSDAVGVGRRLVTGLNMPASWTAADLTFTGSDQPSGTFNAIYDSDGNELTVSASSGRAIALTPAEMDALSAFAAIKIRSGTSGAAVVQLAEREIGVVLK